MAGLKTRKGRRRVGRTELAGRAVLSPGLVARLAGCSANTVKMWLRRGLLAGRRGPTGYGAGWLVRREDLEAFGAAHGIPGLQGLAPGDTTQ